MNINMIFAVVLHRLRSQSNRRYSDYSGRCPKNNLKRHYARMTLLDSTTALSYQNNLDYVKTP